MIELEQDKLLFFLNLTQNEEKRDLEVINIQT